MEPVGAIAYRAAPILIESGLTIHNYCSILYRLCPLRLSLVGSGKADVGGGNLTEEH